MEVGCLAARTSRDFVLPGWSLNQALGLSELRRVRSPGIEPGYAASETTILSVELRARVREDEMFRMGDVEGQVEMVMVMRFGGLWDGVCGG